MPKCNAVIFITSFEAGFTGPIKCMDTLYSIHNRRNILTKQGVFTNCKTHSRLQRVRTGYDQARIDLQVYRGRSTLIYLLLEFTNSFFQ